MTFKGKLLCFLLLPFVLPGQSDRGTITGTVSDSSNSMVPNAAIVAKNRETGASYQTVSTQTGNFTLPSLPAGQYDITVEAPGFKRYTRNGEQVRVAEAVRVDAKLELGSATESVTVQAETAELKTESAEQSMNVNGNRINALPLNFGGGGGGTGAIRDPLAFIVLSPGVVGSGSGASINGFGGSTYRVMFEGQDTTSGNANARANETQGSVEMIEEFTLQTSNFSAEYGQVTGGLVNFTSRSGTNQFHGSGYEYFTNEALNATRPFSNVNPFSRKNDWGFTVGGPVRIPHIYNGKDRTFFFFNFEKYDNTGSSNGTFATVPTDAMRKGDFSAVLTGRVLGTDSQGRSILENTIYDPGTSTTVNGVTTRNPFPNNVVPSSSFDPVSLKIQALIPEPTIPGALVNNWNQNALSSKHQYIPGVKIDHSFTDTAKMSFYWSRENTHQYSSADGLPAPITAVRDQRIYSHTLRANFDKTITPRFLVHAGVGYIRYLNPDSSPPSVLQNYDAVANLGYIGGATTGFPRLNSLSTGNAGGMGLGMGPTNANYYYNDKFTSVLSGTYIHDNHTFKAGASLQIDIWTDRNSRGATGVLNFSNADTGLPSTQGQNLGGGSIGLNYASFLLGLVDNSTVNAIQDPQWRKPEWALYAQDTWKITRRLTLDYGLRWDYMTEGHEIHYRTSMFGPSIPNPSAGGLLGGLVYEGYGAGRCNCQFVKPYPYAVAPRLGVAFQLDPKTVIRAGWGIVYGQISGYNYITNSAILGVGFNQLTFSSPTFGTPAFLLKNGMHYNQADLYSTTLNPGLVPSPGQLNSPNYYLDPNGARPPRINEWSIGVQREVLRSLVAEANYVGNRGVWETANSLVSLNAITPQILAAHGLNLNNAADRSLLTSTLGSSAAISRGFTAPYAGFPLTATVAQSIRPYPQFNGGLSPTWAPLGKSWYDSLQAKLTKRYSHGLDLTSSFTWSKTLANPGASVNNIFNRDNQKSITSNDIPFVLVVGWNYEVPRFTQNRLVHLVAGGWNVGGLLQYQSGGLISVPGSQNQLGLQIFQNTLMNRVPGQSLYLKDPNCHCINPTQDLILNPAAWQDAVPGQWGYSSPLYDDYRQARRPNEQMSIGRTFHIREHMSLSIRAEFFNIFNRTELGSPCTNNNNPCSTVAPNATTTYDGNHNLTGGFGYINPTSIAAQPRNGQLVARFQW